MTTSTAALLALIASLAAEPAGPPSASNAIDLRSFAADVKQAGTDLEDWQPAFQKAVEAARRRGRPLHVPAGEYKIRKAIEILPFDRPAGTPDRRGLRILGDGQGLSVIVQQVDTENAIDWTGLEYERPAQHGHLSYLAVHGGTVGLNLKWHNYFTLDSCYVRGAGKYGLYTEGWSSRIRNSTFRWCMAAGIRGGTHFNNNIVRDCYFSRNGVGFQMTGGYGNRIEGCGFEVCAKAAVFLRGASSFTINNCYFEGNGYKTSKHFPVEGDAHTVHLDYACKKVTIHDNIFRSNKDPQGASLSIAYLIGGHVYDNLFLNTHTAVKLQAACETNSNAKPVIARTVVEGNMMDNVEEVLAEATPGARKQALTRGSAFRMSLRRTCAESPLGRENPESIGDEILDVTHNRWYKSTGPTSADWVPLN